MASIPPRRPHHLVRVALERAIIEPAPHLPARESRDAEQQLHLALVEPAQSKAMRVCRGDAAARVEPREPWRAAGGEALRRQLCARPGGGIGPPAVPAPFGGRGPAAPGPAPDLERGAAGLPRGPGVEMLVVAVPRVDAIVDL